MMRVIYSVKNVIVLSMVVKLTTKCCVAESIGRNFKI